MHLKNLIIFFLVLNISLIYATDSVLKFKEKNYYFFQAGVGFWKAQALCAEKKLDILTIADKEESDFINETVKKLTGKYWIGLFRLFTVENKRHWHWFDTGEKQDFSNWCSNEETADTPGEYCTLAYPECWRNWPCYSTHSGYICQERNLPLLEEDEEEEETKGTKKRVTIEAEVRTTSEPEPELEPDSELEPEPDSELEPEPDSELEPEPDSELEPEPDDSETRELGHSKEKEDDAHAEKGVLCILQNEDEKFCSEAAQVIDLVKYIFLYGE